MLNCNLMKLLFVFLLGLSITIFSQSIFAVSGENNKGTLKLVRNYDIGATLNIVSTTPWHTKFKLNFLNKSDHKIDMQGSLVEFDSPYAAKITSVWGTFTGSGLSYPNPIKVGHASKTTNINLNFGAHEEHDFLGKQTFTLIFGVDTPGTPAKLSDFSPVRVFTKGAPVTYQVKANISGLDGAQAPASAHISVGDYKTEQPLHDGANPISDVPGGTYPVTCDSFKVDGQNYQATNCPKTFTVSAQSKEFSVQYKKSSSTYQVKANISGLDGAQAPASAHISVGDYKTEQPLHDGANPISNVPGGTYPVTCDSFTVGGQNYQATNCPKTVTVSAQSKEFSVHYQKPTPGQGDVKVVLTNDRTLKGHKEANSTQGITFINQGDKKHYDFSIKLISGAAIKDINLPNGAYSVSITSPKGYQAVMKTNEVFVDSNSSILNIDYKFKGSFTYINSMQFQELLSKKDKEINLGQGSIKYHCYFAHKADAPFYQPSECLSEDNFAFPTATKIILGHKINESKLWAMSTAMASMIERIELEYGHHTYTYNGSGMPNVFPNYRNDQPLYKTSDLNPFVKEYLKDIYGSSTIGDYLAYNVGPNYFLARCLQEGNKDCTISNRGLYDLFLMSDSNKITKKLVCPADNKYDAAILKNNLGYTVFACDKGRTKLISFPYTRKEFLDLIKQQEVADWFSKNSAYKGKGPYKKEIEYGKGKLTDAIESHGGHSNLVNSGPFQIDSIYTGVLTKAVYGGYSIPFGLLYPENTVSAFSGPFNDDNYVGGVISSAFFDTTSYSPRWTFDNGSALLNTLKQGRVLDLLEQTSSILYNQGPSSINPGIFDKNTVNSYCVQTYPKSGSDMRWDKKCFPDIGSYNPDDPSSSSTGGLYPFQLPYYDHQELDKMSFYETKLTWDDIKAYLQLIGPKYYGFYDEYDINRATNAAKKAFESLTNNQVNSGTIDFRTQFSQVLNAIMPNLPVYIVEVKAPLAPGEGVVLNNESNSQLYLQSATQNFPIDASGNATVKKGTQMKTFLVLSPKRIDCKANLTQLNTMLASSSKVSSVNLNVTADGKCTVTAGD